MLKSKWKGTKEEFLKEFAPPVCYVEYLDPKNNFKPSKKDFSSFEEAWKWILETFDTPSKDFIGWY
jgi:hypothetical protein